jgi:methylmalonyl-CoA/ethylmalonyl-CoA epimerase
MLKRINHIAIVVPEINDAKRFWIDVMGLQIEHEGHVHSQKVDVTFLPISESNIELLQPTDTESGVAKYLSNRGAGMHHICFEVDDIEAVLSQLSAAEIRLIDEQPRIGDDGKKYAFIHPKATGGVLVELYQL